MVILPAVKTSNGSETTVAPACLALAVAASASGTDT